MCSPTVGRAYFLSTVGCEGWSILSPAAYFFAGVLSIVAVWYCSSLSLAQRVKTPSVRANERLLCCCCCCGPCFLVGGGGCRWKPCSANQMDKTGKGVVSLPDFKAAMMERRLTIVQKDHHHQQQQQENDEPILGTQGQPQEEPSPAGDADVAAAAAPNNGGGARSEGEQPDAQTPAAPGAPAPRAHASDEELPPGRGEKGAGEGGSSVGTGEANEGTAAAVETPAAPAHAPATATAPAPATAAPPEAASLPAPPSDLRKTTSSVSMEEIGTLVRELSDNNRGALTATTPSSDSASGNGKDIAQQQRSPRKLYRTQSSRTRTIGGLDEEGVSET